MPASGRPLTPRQQDVLDRVAQGKPNKQIGAELGISERAVKALVTRLFGKLGVPNRAALIATVLRAGTSTSSLTAGPAGDLSQYVDAPFMIAVLQGPRHEFVFANRMFVRVSGIAADGLIGRELDKVFWGGEIVSHPLVEAVLATGIPAVRANRSSRWLDGQGQIRTGVFHTLIHPLRDATGSVDALLTVTTAVEHTDQRTV